MWPSTSTRQSSRPDVVVENNASTSPFYPQHPDRGRPSKAAGYDTLDGGGSGICEPETDEGLDESLEEIAELEGELSSEGEELEGGGNFMGEMDCSRMNGRKSTTPFEGINFAQLFSASAAHSEQFINLAKQFYPVSSFVRLARPRMPLCCPDEPLTTFSRHAVPRFMSFAVGKQVRPTLCLLTSGT